ncbi:DUF5325 family protein [Ammoniphilus oxalaticus]|uniref:DUF5325 family protein n=1 Tax=Ammoniphilus oxalaticus TaxID=66863 RepID=UPI0014760030|nr:DUF5325 family protein [Ammoniphilus oxalaticus]
MTQWKKISLVIAIVTTLFLSGIGIFIAEANLAGILICVFGAVVTPGLGFMFRKRLN